MKIGRIFLILISFCVATTAGFAAEKKSKSADMPVKAGDVPTQKYWLGSKADSNNDGVVSGEEARAASDAQRAEVIAKFNKDMSGDGKVDAFDRQLLKDTFLRSSRESRESRQNPDTNGDGTVDGAEKEAVKQREIAKGAEWKTETDVNKDGIVDEREEKTAMDAWEQTHPDPYINFKNGQTAQESPQPASSAKKTSGKKK